jgi:ketosteroid isomerase-like protein
MAEHPNAERIRRAFDAFAQGDMATMTELIAEDTIWHIPGRGPLSGDHRGRAPSLHCSVGWCRGRREPSPRSCMMRWPATSTRSR